MTREEIETWEKLYEKDLPIIGGFLKQKGQSKTYRLFFKDGTQIIADFIGASDSDNGLELNDPYYENFYEMDFRVKRIEKKGSELDYKENQGLSLNYHNFFIKFEPYKSDL